MNAKAITWEEAVLWLRNQPDQAELVRACFYDDPLPAAAERYYARGAAFLPMRSRATAGRSVRWSPIPAT
jgi:hypothetical protein